MCRGSDDAARNTSVIARGTWHPRLLAGEIDLVKGVLLLALRDPIRSCWHEFKGEGQDGGRNSREKPGFPQELGTACPPGGRMEIPFAGEVHNFLLVDSDVIPCRKWTT